MSRQRVGWVSAAATVVYRLAVVGLLSVIAIFQQADVSQSYMTQSAIAGRITDLIDEIKIQPEYRIELQAIVEDLESIRQHLLWQE